MSIVENRDAVWSASDEVRFEELLNAEPPPGADSREFFRSRNKDVTVKPPLISGVGEKLRRFIDLPKLFDLLSNRRVIFPPWRKLITGDPFECFAQRTYTAKSR